MGFVRRLTGETAADAATQAGEIQSQAGIDAAGNVLQAGQQAGELIGGAGTLAGQRIGSAGQQAQDLFSPFQQIGQQGVDQASFLTDPKAQFDFLQNNPLFKLGLDNANTQTNQFAAARGRLSAGDTLQQLNQNALLTASPLIQQQKQSIGDLLRIGQGAAGNQSNILQNTAGSQAGILQNTAGNQANILQNTAANQGNLLTGAAAAQAGGIVGAENARGAGQENLLNLGGQIAGFFSDPSLKSNITLVDFFNGYNIYTWDWNAKAFLLGLFGSSRGVMADEVLKQNPEAITIDRGYMKVNYNAIGVKY